MPGDALRLVFAGTPEFAAVHLRGLLDAGVIPVAVYTQPDRPAGRGKKLTASPVKQLAVESGIPVLQPTSLRNPDAHAGLMALKPDLMIVVAYGLILPQGVLGIPRAGCINVHASLLPRWRGAAPIQRAIEAGDSETGITIMQMDVGLDTGPMLARIAVPIGPRMTAGVLHDALAATGVPLLLEVLENLDVICRQAEDQDESGATYAAKIDKSEARIDWSRPAAELDCRIRAFNPFPVCWSHLGDQRIRVWQAEPGENRGKPGTILAADNGGVLVACGEGSLKLTVLQLPGGKPLTVDALLRSRGDWFNAGGVLR
jgi:methionyl-tRNA formyltransferase